MKRISLLLVFCAAIMILSGSALAWTCPSGQHWVQVPSGTTGGTLKVIEGITFQCQPDNPKNPKNGSKNTNTNNNTNNNSNSNTNTNNLTNKQNQTQNQSQGQTQTANSSSNVSDSGNSSSTSAASNNGNNSNNYSTSYKAAEIPVATAYAPTTIPTVTCFKGFGAGVQTMPIGASFGGGKIDENCAILETARAFDAAGERLAACMVKISNKYAKAAGVTLENCMTVVTPPVVAETQAPVQPQIVVVPVNNPTPALVTPVVDVPVPTSQLLGICTFANKTACVPAGGDAEIVDPARPTRVCKEMIAAVVKAQREHPGSIVILRGNRNNSEDKLLATSRANNVKRELEARGVKSGTIKVETGTGTSRTVDIILAPQS